MQPISESLSVLLAWIDRFVFENYRVPELRDVMDSGLYASQDELIQDRAELVTAGLLSPSDWTDGRIYFIPHWIPDFIDHERREMENKKHLLDSVKGKKQHGHY